MNFTATQVTPFSNNRFHPASAAELELIGNALLSHLCGFDMNSELFRNQLPPTICDAVFCSLCGEEPSQAPGTRDILFRITCRGSSENSTIFTKLKQLLSYAGEELFIEINSPELRTPVVVSCMTLQDKWQVARQFFGGVSVPHIIWDLRLSIVCRS